MEDSQGDRTRAAVWKGRRTVLGGGFGCVIILLVFSTVEAYRIQSTVFEQHVDSYKRYLEDEDAVARLRRNTLIGSIYVRDFFLSGQSDRGAVLEKQLGELAAENLDALSRLERRAGRGKALTGLRVLLDDFWRTLEPIPARMPQVRGAAGFDFVQREIVPRREAVQDATLQFSGESQRNFQLRETDLAVRRRLAAQRLATLLGACLILGIVVSWLSLRHVERLAREAAGHYSAALETKRELQELSARLIDLQEEERRSIARGLHDEIGQTLTALRLEISHALGRAEGAEVRERLERARALAEKTVRTVRDISLVLRPALLDDLGLVPALEWQIEEFSRRSGVACEFSARDVEESLPDAVKTCVFRVVQEALNNCEKHAAASKAWVSLRQESGRLTVELGDDGRGFQTELHRREATGLVGMRERAIRLGGQLVCGSAPGRGTRIVLTIPLAHAGVQAKSESRAARA